MGHTDKPPSRQTKAELLESYEAMRAAYEEKNKEQLPLAAREAKKQEEVRIVERVAAHTAGSVEEDIAGLRKKISAALDDLQMSLTHESEGLSNVRAAIDIERRHLEDIRHIKLSDDALQILLAEYDQKRQALERDAQETRERWNREAEAYAYELKQKRRKEEDDYRLNRDQERRGWDDEMAKKEADVECRRQELKAQEEELASLRSQAANAPAERDAAVSRAVAEREQALTREFDHEKQLLLAAHEAKRQMLSAKNESLDDLIKRQAAELASYKAAVAEATRHSQTLASTVIESVSGAKHLKDAVAEMKEHQKE